MTRVGLFLIAVCSFAQTPRKLTLADAEAQAVRNHPRIQAAKLNAQAASENARQVKAANSMFVSANLTAAGADHGTATGAGAVTTSSLFSRTAVGVTITQTLLDFGRNGSLWRSFQLRASAQDEMAGAARAEILLRVRESYFLALAMQAQMRVANETVRARKTSLKQIQALAASNLRSTLDQSFAELNVSEAELALSRAENDAHAAMLYLAAAIGSGDDQVFELHEEPLPAELESTVGALVRQALDSRPDLAASRLRIKAAQSFADSERRLAFPTLSALGAGGAYGPHDDRLRPRYAGVALNLNIPLFNGQINASRRREAELRASAVAEEARELEIRIAQDVRTAWLDARNAQQRVTLAAKVLDLATRTLKLAQARYELGLGSIVELNQAQLSRTAGDVAASTTLYEYLTKRARLDYQTGGIL
ncbi:MAG: TolC family protein [Bryobacterales bacterium]|nr:TolC family protein [Bryobacterales bacterium]